MDRRRGLMGLHWSCGASWEETKEGACNASYCVTATCSSFSSSSRSKLRCALVNAGSWSTWSSTSVRLWRLKSWTVSWSSHLLWRGKSPSCEFYPTQSISCIHVSCLTLLVRYQQHGAAWHVWQRGVWAVGSRCGWVQPNDLRLLWCWKVGGCMAGPCVICKYEGKNSEATPLSRSMQPLPLPGFQKYTGLNLHYHYYITM